MTRHVRLAIVLALLVATTVAFVVTERLKLQPAPITATRVTKAFAPECECPTHVAEVEFRLRRRDTLTVTILNPRRAVTRTLVERTAFRAGLLTFDWDGRSDSGQVVPERSYRPRVEFARAGRSITLPNPIRVDLTPPSIHLVSASPRTISPDGDGHADRITLRYRQSEPGRPLLFVGRTVRVRAHFPRPVGKLDWYGKIAGRPLPPGTYRLTLTTRDVAGNLARRAAHVLLHVRYIELARRVVSARAGKLFRVRVRTDAHRVHWRLGRRTGTADAPVFRLRAPMRPGRYRLVVSEQGFRAHGSVTVRRR